MSKCNYHSSSSKVRKITCTSNLQPIVSVMVIRKASCDREISGWSVITVLKAFIFNKVEALRNISIGWRSICSLFQLKFVEK